MRNKVKMLPADQIRRVFEVDRTEQIEAEYVPKLGNDGLAIRLELHHYEPPRTFPNWDEEGRRRRGEWWRQELDKGGVLLVVEVAGRVIGFAVRGPAKRDRSAEILGMFVDSGRRGGGIGRRLLESLEQNARDSDIRALYGGVNPTERTIRFYLQSGYRIKALIDETIDTWPIAETAIIMAKPLTNRSS